VEALASSGLAGVATDAALQAADGGRPFLGICVGLQLLYGGSDECPEVQGLGVMDGRVALLTGDVKIPQMQWNRLEPRADHPMFEGLGDEPWTYFVHSYAPPVGPDTVATCQYGGEVCAAIASGNLWACQFHPEKSGDTGLRILSNFVAGLASVAA
jgi:glutamine amidotransferase